MGAKIEAHNHSQQHPTIFPQHPTLPTPYLCTMPATIDSMIALATANKPAVFAITHAHQPATKTLEFYLILAIVLFLGIIRLTDPKYFTDLWLAFRNPQRNFRQSRDKLYQPSFTNFLMNIFFTLTAGFYLYYVAGSYIRPTADKANPGLMLLLITVGMMAIYLIKYLVVRFSGWAFRVEGITENYIFNVFLINKVIAVVLLPFVILLAFGAPQWIEPSIIISTILLVFLFANRYVRSWTVFGSFFQYSKFQFFTYLCASELLPLAILIKLLVRGLP
jgi:MFS family permease